LLGAENLSLDALDWARPSSSSKEVIASIKLLLRLPTRVRIGVRAAGKTKPTSKKRRGSVPEANSQPEFIEPMT
jgi:hypothetical protein